MNALIDKVASLLPKLEERGAVYLFALVEREDVERWDVVMSAEWSDENWSAAVRFIVDLLKPQLLPEEITMISRIAIIPSSDPKIDDMPASLDGVVRDDHRVINVAFLESDVRRAFIFRAQRPPAVRSGQTIVGVAAHL